MQQLRHPAADSADVVVCASAEFRRQGVRSKVGCAHGEWQFAPEAARNAQAARFLVQAQAVPRLDFQRGYPFGHQCPGPTQRSCKQVVVAGSAGGCHGGPDATAGACNVFVTGTLQAHLEFTRALATVDQMGMAIHQAGCDQGALQVVVVQHVVQESARHGILRTSPDDGGAVGQQCTVFYPAPRLRSVQSGQAGIAPPGE